MIIALFKGRSFWPSKLIEWITRSEYSHAGFVFDTTTARLARDMAQAGALTRLPCFDAGTCVEAWSGGVKCSPSISTQHTDKTPVDLFQFTPGLTEEQERQLILILDGQFGMPYDYRDVLFFLTKQAPRPGGRLFCSELVAKDCRDIGAPLLVRIEPGAVHPGMLAVSLRLAPAGSTIT